MAVKTFTTGEVLTAADTNTYLANAGLDYVKSQTIGSAVTSTTVTNAFSSTWDAYRVVITNVVFSTANNAVAIRLGSSTTRTDYKWGEINFTLTTGAFATGTANGTAEGMRIGYTSTTATSFSVDILGPYLAIPTNHHANGFGEGNYVGLQMGYDASAVSYADMTLRPGSGTMTGGTIVVYGYRKA